MFRWSFYPVADSYLLVSGAALVLLGLLTLGPSRAKTAGPRRRTLVAIRVVAVVLVILAMLRPTLVYTKTEKQSATLVVLADGSRSMSVPDEAQGMTRWEALRQTLGDAKDALMRVDEDFEIRAYSFDAQAHPAEVVEGEIQLADRPDGDQTAIGSVLEDVLRNEAGKRPLRFLTVRPAFIQSAIDCDSVVRKLQRQAGICLGQNILPVIGILGKE